MNKIIGWLALVCLMACQSTTEKARTTTDTSVVASAASSELPTTESTRAKGFGRKTFVGQINEKLKVVFQLQEVNGEVSGTYFYEKTGLEIPVEGVLHDNVLVLYELDYSRTKTAKITGKLNQREFSGTWESLTSKKTFPITLAETDKKVRPLPAAMEGVYKNDGSGCMMTLEIRKVRGEYQYVLQTTQRELKGRITFYRSLDENANYINLEGIQWAENNGDVSNEEDSDDPKDLPLPTGIEGMLDDNEITIQNSGNAMNSYLKLQDCDEKYIHFKK